MKLHAYTPAALFAVLLSTLLPSLATNPPGGTCSSRKGPCPEDSSSGASTGSSSGIGAGSLTWRANLGLARYPKPPVFTGLAQSAFEPDGNLPSFPQMLDRYFPKSPLQVTQIHLEFNVPRLTAECFRPSIVGIQSEAIFEKLTMPATAGVPQHIHQVITDDGFTLIEPLAGPELGFRVRVWRRPATLPAKVGGFYPVAGFENIAPLGDFTFKRPDGVGDYRQMLYIQKENTGVSGARVFTQHIVESPSGAARPDQLTIATHQGEGASGALLRREILNYSARGAKEWDYTVDRTVEVADMNTDGTTGALQPVASTREVCQDFSTAAIGGEAGMKRVLSLTEACNVAGQTPQTTTHTYIDAPGNRTLHGRLQSTVRPDGSWLYIETQGSESSPVVVTTEYSSWGDVPLSNKEAARKVTSSTGGAVSTTLTTIGNQLVGKTQSSLGNGGNSLSEAKWDGSNWLTTTTSYYPESAPAASVGRICEVVHPDGTRTRYAYAVDSAGRLVETRREGNGANTAGTEIKTTYGIGDIPVSEETKDIASGLVLERWDTDLGYYGGFDRIGRPIRRIFNGNPDDYDESTYACCGLESRRDRDGVLTRYDRDPLKRVYRTTVTPGAGSEAYASVTHTAITGLTTTTTRSFGSSAPVFVGTVTRSLDGLTATTVSPSRKSNNAADRIVTRSQTDPATRTTTVAYQAGAAWNPAAPTTTTRTTTSYMDGSIHMESGIGLAPTTYTYTPHNINGGGITTTANAAGRLSVTVTDLLDRTISSSNPATGTINYGFFRPLPPPDCPENSPVRPMPIRSRRPTATIPWATSRPRPARSPVARTARSPTSSPPPPAASFPLSLFITFHSARRLSAALLSTASPWPPATRPPPASSPAPALWKAATRLRFARARKSPATTRPTAC